MSSNQAIVIACAVLSIWLAVRAYVVMVRSQRRYRRTQARIDALVRELDHLGKENEDDG